MRVRHAVASIGWSVAAAASAHHGWSGCDTGKPLALTGTIVASGDEHPHGFVRLKTCDKTWRAGLAPRCRLRRVSA